MNIKISRIRYFSFSFKLNEKKKVALKLMVWRRGVTRKFLLEGGFDLQWEGWKYFKEMGELTRKGRGKIDGGCDPQRKRNYVHYAGKQPVGKFSIFY